MRWPLIILQAFLFHACSKPKLTKEALMKDIKRHDPDAVEVLPESMDEGITCAPYNAGCIRGLQAKAMGLKFILVEFESAELAANQASELGGVSIQNWFIDDIAREPRLVLFFSKYLGAKPAPQTREKFLTD